MTTIALSAHRSGLRAALNSDWARLVDAGLPSRWHAVAPLTGCRDLDGVLTRIRERPDPTLSALLELCADDDQLAGRSVLQAMLGKLVRLAGCDPSAGLDDYVTAMWFRIRTYPLAERPRRIAANLALDTLKSVQHQSHQPRGVDVTPYPPDVIVELSAKRAAMDEDEISARTVIEVAAQLGVISLDTGAVLTSVYVDGLNGAAAAARHGKSQGAVRVQCHKAVRRLAQHSPTLALVA